MQDHLRARHVLQESECLPEQEEEIKQESKLDSGLEKKISRQRHNYWIIQHLCEGQQNQQQVQIQIQIQGEGEGKIKVQIEREIKGADLQAGQKFSEFEEPGQELQPASPNPLFKEKSVKYSA